MNVVIVIEIVIGLVLLAVVVRYAVRDARRRAASAASEDDTGPGIESTTERPERSSEHDTEQAPSEVADRA